MHPLHLVNDHATSKAVFLPFHAQTFGRYTADHVEVEFLSTPQGRSSSLRDCYQGWKLICDSLSYCLGKLWKRFIGDESYHQCCW